MKIYDKKTFDKLFNEYKNQNKEATPIEFIDYQINLHKGFLDELNEISDAYLLNEIESKYFESHSKYGDYEDFKLRIYESDKSRLENDKSKISKIIEKLEIKKNNYLFPTIIIKIKKNNSLKPKHENVFANNGFVLFEHILNEYIKPKDVKGRQSDLIFYYWKMYDNEPQFIHKRPTEFFNWFDEKYTETSGQLRTLLQVEKIQRNKDYSDALDWFKQQPQQVL